MQKSMSALLPKADMCGALAHVCFVPEADIAVSLNNLVGGQKNAIGYSDAKCFGRFEIDH